MTNYFRKEPKRSYNLGKWKPYGAGDLFAMDQRVDPDFEGNVPEQLLSEGFFLVTEDGRLLDKNGDYVAQFEEDDNEKENRN